MSGTDYSKITPTVFEGVTPILTVRSLSASVDYYLKVLGFKLEWEYPETIASVSRDRCGIFLCEGDQGNPGCWIWIGVSDVESLYKDYRVKGAKIRHPPTNYPWAIEMQVQDLDGNVLRLGSEAKTDQPFGEWLDMRGRAWVMSSDGGWTQVESS